MKAMTKCKERGRCVYGFIGTFDDALKPLLLVYLVGSFIGTGFLAVLCEDGTRSFVLSTTLHLLPEMFVWTHLLFPPALTGHDANVHTFFCRWSVRSSFALASLVVLLGPVQQSNGRIGPLVTGTFIGMAGVSDCLGLWLGLVMMIRRNHRAARRLGVAFFVHGLAFHLVAYEFIRGGDAFSIASLRGFGWLVLLVVTFYAFLGLVSLFKEPLDMRLQRPSPGELRFIVGGVVTSLLVMPVLLATNGSAPDLSAILSNPMFLPQDPYVLVAYKFSVPILALSGTVHVLNAYVDSGLPILPTVRAASAQYTDNQKPEPPERTH
jgi:hypothetical protein